MHIVDRLKDVIKSGGEWISSIEIENIVMGHPEVAQAAVVGIPHDKWGERPLLLVVPASGAKAEKAEVLAYLDGKIAKWWLPEDVMFMDHFPTGPTGKILKRELRRQFEGGHS